MKAMKKRFLEVFEAAGLFLVIVGLGAAALWAIGFLMAIARVW